MIPTAYNLLIEIAWKLGTGVRLRASVPNG